MATGPHVVVEKEAIFLDEEPRPDEDAIAALGDGRTQYRYYESQKVLGKLYRAIDEVAVFRELQKQSSSLGKDDLSSQSIMQRLWSYVQNETCLIQWRHHQDWARDIQET